MPSGQTLPRRVRTKVHLHWANANVKANVFFDLCRCSVWTWNWMLYEPIWKRCSFGFCFRDNINEPSEVLNSIWTHLKAMSLSLLRQYERSLKSRSENRPFHGWSLFQSQIRQYDSMHCVVFTFSLWFLPPGPCPLLTGVQAHAYPPPPMYVFRHLFFPFSPH